MRRITPSWVAAGVSGMLVLVACGTPPASPGASGRDEPSSPDASVAAPSAVSPSPNAGPATPLPQAPGSPASAVFEAGQHPCGMTTDGELIWVTTLRSNGIVAIDPATNTIVRDDRLGPSPCGLAYLQGSLWHEERVRFLVRRDATTLDKQGEILLNGTVSDVRATDDAVWIVVAEPGRVARVDPVTNEITDSLNVGAPARGLAVGAGSVWVAVEGTDAVARIDPVARRVLATIPVGDGPVWLVAGEDGVWVSTINDDAVHHIDPASNTVVRSVPVGDMPLEPEVADGHVWVPNSGDGTITKIDAASGDVVATFEIGPSPAVIRHLFGDLWVTGLATEGRVYRLPLDAGS